MNPVRREDPEQALALGEFIDASPSPYHAVSACLGLLTEAGFTVLDERRRWPAEPGRYAVVRGGALVAWSTEALGGTGAQAGVWPAGAGFTVVGGHTDSPNLRLKPRPDRESAGWDMLGVEVYGGPLLHTWFDRDLGISGRAAVRDDSPAGYAMRLFRDDSPLLRVANLAIHLDRSSGDGSAPLDRQAHLAPLWGATGGGSFRDWLADRLEVRPADVLAFDAMTHDLTPSAVLGRDGDLLAAPRLDNLATAYAATVALVRAVTDPSADGASRPASDAAGDVNRAPGLHRAPQVPVLALFDHEEIGSLTRSGGQSQLLPAVLERIVLAAGGDRADVLEALASTLVCSADMAHATHPNRADRHEPQHHIAVGGGPVLKVNAQGRYASDAVGAAAFALACERAGVPMQTYAHRTDLPCGSTIGPMSAALTGAVTVDVGAPMLSMHSARELMGVADVGMYVGALSAVFGADVVAPGRLA